ncbi:MAG: ribosome-associated translation inhibitor RaiA [Clostridia bacterium]|nr:ribosome-associated translation inhibitor RaiA [Clostridia bacterium]
MKFNIIARKYDLKENVREYAQKKLSKLDKFFRDEPSARLVFGTIKDNDYIEAQINAGGIIYRAECEDKEILAAIDRIVDVIERQIRKNKTRLAKRIKSSSVADNKLISGASYVDEEDTSEFEIVKRKRFTVKPMAVEEAILQMKLLGHGFFVFKNMETSEMNVVYERKDGKYALIESVD